MSGVTRSANSGWSGATKALTRSLNFVKRAFICPESMFFSPTKSCRVCFGNNLSMTPTSPNCRSRSRSIVRVFFSLARATARLVAMTVLPTPPLVLKTVIMRPLVLVSFDPRRFPAAAALLRQSNSSLLSMGIPKTPVNPMSDACRRNSVE